MWYEIINNSIPDFDVNCYAIVDPDMENGISTSMHNHWQLELMYVDYGAIDYIFYDEETVSLKTGDIIFVNSMIPHQTQTRVPKTSVFVVQFVLDKFLKGSLLERSQYLSAFVKSNNVSWRLFQTGSNHKLRDSIKSVYSENTRREKGYEIMILSNLYCILGELFRKDVMKFHIDAKQVDMPSMQDVLAFIDQNYMRNIKLEDTANVANISVTHFCRMFKKFTGTSFVRYVNFIRVCEAEKLLSRTDKSITEIAYTVGFSSNAYFDKIFKMHYKINPTKYREMKQREQIEAKNNKRPAAEPIAPQPEE